MLGVGRRPQICVIEITRRKVSYEFYGGHVGGQNNEISIPWFYKSAFHAKPALKMRQDPKG